MNNKYNSLCDLIRSGKLIDADLQDIRENIQKCFYISCEKGHEDIAEWLYCLSKRDGNTKVLINVGDDYAFRWACYEWSQGYS
jgi:hypothetical protein